MNINHVLDREKERKYCNECHAIWIIFQESDKTEGVYRIAATEPGNCSVCGPIDKEIESQCIMSHETWEKIA